jgi:methionyl-tRNA formyltransferase
MTKEDLRIVFMGTPEFAVTTLRALVEHGYNVVAVVTQPDKPVGRHAVLTAPPVKKYALEQGIPVLQPEKMKDPAFQEALSQYRADLQVVVAFRMLPEQVWAMPRFGTFNVHASLLPQYRGAAPINWAIINGEKETGVTTFFLDRCIDTGRIIMQRRYPIASDANVEQVYDGLMHLGADVAMETIDRLIAGRGTIESVAQSEEGDLKPAPKIFKETCEIDWHRQCRQVYDFIRGLSPVPGAWSGMTLHEGQAPQVVKFFAAKTTSETAGSEPGTLKVDKKRLLVATSDCWLEITELQLAGKKRMKAADFINGLKK